MRRLIWELNGLKKPRQEAKQEVTNSFESETSSTKQPTDPHSGGWLRLGVIAAASALAGGVAAAWWYRNTLQKLRQAEERPTNPEYGISGEGPADES
jgi:hypothetical protein